MLKILQLLAPAQVGGLERVVQGLAAGLHDRGHSVTVVAVATGADELAPFLEPLISRGVEVREIRVPHRAYLRERHRMAEVCRELNPDVVHTHGYRPDVLARGPAQRQGIATVTTVHGFTGNGWRNRFYEALQVRAFKKFDAVVAVSEPLRAGLVASGVPGDRAWMIRNAPVSLGSKLSRDEARDVLSLPPEAPIVGWVGRMSPEKGPDVLLRAMTLIGDPQVRVSYVGDGPERRALEARAREMVGQGLLESDQIRFHGNVPDAGRLLTAFDLLVLSSRTEGTPMILFEAMDAEVPVVTTEVGGVPDVVTEQEAILVPSEDPEALARGIRRVLDTPADARQRAKRAGYRLRREFTPERWLDAYENLYHDVIASRRV
ncbi:MAG: glycosyltransferase, partial [Thermoanaerobaculia bacterium]